MGVWSDSPSILQLNSLCCNVQFDFIPFKHHHLARTCFGSGISVIGIHSLQQKVYMLTFTGLITDLPTPVRREGIRDPQHQLKKYSFVTQNVNLIEGSFQGLNMYVYYTCIYIQH